MSDEPKHTPTPWEIDDLAISSVNLPEDGGDIICEAPIGWDDSMKRWEANAARIVKCVNEYDGLNDQLESLRAERDELVEVLRLTFQSLCTYGSHPIIERHVNVTLAKYEK